MSNKKKNTKIKNASTLNKISDHITDDILPQMNILNTVIPYLYACIIKKKKQVGTINMSSFSIF